MLPPPSLLLLPLALFFYFFVVESKISNWFLCCALCFTRFSFLLCALRTHLAKSKCQHHLTSRRNETTPLQSRKWSWRWRRRRRWRRSQAAAALSSALTQHEIQICTERCDVPFRGQTEVRSMSLSSSSSPSPPAWLLAAAPLLPRCKLQLQLLFAVSFFIFESSSCTRSMESSASHSSPTPTPASASSPASAPSAVPAAVRRRDAFSRCLRISKFCFQRSISENRPNESRTSTCRYPVKVRKIRVSPYIPTIIIYICFQ